MSEDNIMPAGREEGGGLCRDPFFNASLTWDTEDPDLTSCLRKTLLIWLPCGLYWLALPFHLRSLFKRPVPGRAAGLSSLTTCKTLFAILLVLLAAVDLVYWCLDADVYPVDVAEPAVRLATFASVLALVQLERERAARISPVQFLFFLIDLLLGVLNLYSGIKGFVSGQHSTQLLPLVTLISTYLMGLASFICHFFAEPQPVFQAPAAAQQPDSPAQDTPNVCPATTASFPSILTFSWFTSLAWTGFKRPLTSQDLWLLPEHLASASVVPAFLRHWEPKFKRVALHNATDTAASTTPEGGAGNVSFNKTDENVQVVPTETGDAEPKRQMAHVFSALVKTFGPRFLFGSCLKFIHDVCVFITPMLFKQILAFASTHDQPMWKGVLYAILIVATTSFQTICLGSYFYKMYDITIGVRSALIAAIYRKSLKISVSGKKDTTTGEIVNLMSVDVNRISDLLLYVNMIWSAPLQIGLSVFFLWGILGPSVLAGLAVIILLVPVNGLIASRIKKLQINQMKEKDKRVKMMNEILQGIKVLKLYAWEPSFGRIVNAIRKTETHYLMKMGYLSAGTSFIWSSASYFVSLVTFATYVLSDPAANVLDPEKAFVSVSLFNILRFPMSMLPMIISMMVQANVSLKRIDKYMNATELKADAVRRLKPAHANGENGKAVEQNGAIGEHKADLAIEINDSSFKWDTGSDVKHTLSNISLQVKKGSLVAVVGQVGAGKSSLISAILGEMDVVTSSYPSVTVDGSVAYVAQQAWVQNATVKNNILFNKPLNKARYDRVVESCALTADMEVLTAGDETEIGEKGINLSGGQKQRISLARAAYNDADIYLLDDPLSAVDAHVGKHIFEKIIGPEGLLKGKTRVLVTHSLTHLRHMDAIFVILDGEICERGTYRELLTNKGECCKFMIQNMAEEDAEEENVLKDLGAVMDKDTVENLRRERGVSSSAGSESRDDLQRSVSRETSPRKRGQSERKDSGTDAAAKGAKAGGVVAKAKGDKQYEAEKSETGKVAWTVYLFYFKSMGVWFASSCLAFFAIHQALASVSGVVLAKWGDSNTNTTVQPEPSSGDDVIKTPIGVNSETNLFLGLYAGLGFGQALAVIMAAIFLCLSTIRGAKKLHDTTLSTILRSPMSFFDTTPQGRILNRFGKDIDVLDATMPQVLRGWIVCLLGVAATFIIISAIIPMFLLPIAFILCGYYFVQKVYIASSRQLKRLESVSRSPIYSNFGETVSGVTTIRAYGMEDQFIKQSEFTVDENQRAGFPSVVSNRWLAVRLETVGNLITFFACLLAALGRDHLTAGFIGLAVSHAMSVTQSLTWLVRMACDVETNVVAVERLKEYTENKTEAEWDLEETKPADEWPAEGKIQFENYSTRYREGLDLVLKDISFEAEGGKRVGIVGRTGAGKSSLTLALFRIIEPAGGRIVIDGTDIATLGLHQLRNKITIIPQEPVLFSGTLRMNLDPFEQYDDSKLFESLRLAHLDTFVKSLDEGLQHPVAEGGENLSVGQRQLICLARALLRKTKVLVLDEATAAVDLETDELIQKTIQKEFAASTVITIAHRLNTIIDYDKILVLSQGQVSEFDTPKHLLANKQSIFYDMCKEAGLVKD